MQAIAPFQEDQRPFFTRMNLSKVHSKKIKTVYTLSSASIEKKTH